MDILGKFIDADYKGKSSTTPVVLHVAIIITCESLPLVYFIMAVNQSQH